MEVNYLEIGNKEIDGSCDGGLNYGLTDGILKFIRLVIHLILAFNFRITPKNILIPKQIPIIARTLSPPEFPKNLLQITNN